MERRQAVLVGLIGLVVLALFFVTVALGSDRDAHVDPERAGGVDLLDELVGRVPGVARTMTAEDVVAPCRVDGRLVVDGVEPCAFALDGAIDRGALRVRSGACSVSIDGQEDTPRQELGPDDVRDGVLRLALDGTGATITVAGAGGPCVLEVD